MGYGKGGTPPGCPKPAPDFARAKGMPKDRQLGTAQPRPASSGQTRMPGDQGGRSESNPKS